jgi:hypothetical protein
MTPSSETELGKVEEQQARGPREPLPAQATQPRPAPRPIAALKTRSGLRRAWLLKVILGPPLALRDPDNDDGQ